jgi:catalase
VLVDGLDFSDDKLLQGRTFSYSDTQRYRVGANYLELPINAPKRPVASNQQGGQMAYMEMSELTRNPHVNYEPSGLGGLREAPPSGPDHMPFVTGNLVRQKIDRQNNYRQAGERFRIFEDWEREELISNLVGALQGCTREIQERMLWHFSQCDAEYGRRVASGLGLSLPSTVPASLKERLPPEALQPATGGPDPRGDSVTSSKASGKEPSGKS